MRAITLLVSLMVGGLWLPGCEFSDPRPQPAIDLEPCRLSGSSGMRSVSAQCGWLSVAENPAQPGGREIRLRVARVPAIAPQFPGTAVTVIAGGPGQASTEFYADYAPAWERVHQHHDILLLDQRGTGVSNPLDCEFEVQLGEEFDASLARSLAQQCLQQLPGDPRFYTTSVAVRDLDAARAALGYSLLDVYGASYGTRVALHYLRHFPEHTRSLVLDGVIAPGQVVGPDIALDAERALQQIFQRCVDDAGCSETFGDPAGQLDSLRRSLEAAPSTVRLADPLTAEPISLKLNNEALAGAVRLLSYSPATAALLPLLVHEAEANGNLQPLTAQAQMSLATIADALNEGMHNAVICTEDVPYFDLDEQFRQRLAATYLGEMVVDSLQAVCSVWPRGIIDTDFHQPWTSDKPVLLLSGALDPVTPPANAERAARSLPNSLHIVAPGQGHGLLGLSCVPALLSHFLHTVDPTSIDPACVANSTPEPFFLRFTGPAP